NGVTFAVTLGEASMSGPVLPFADPAIDHGARALHLESVIGGGGRKRLRSAYPARVDKGRWAVDRKGSWKRMLDFPLPDAIQMPDGQVREVGSGLLFASRIEFLRARDAAA